MVSVPRKVFLCGSRLDVNCDRPPSSKIIIYEWKRVQEAPSIVEYKLNAGEEGSLTTITKTGLINIVSTVITFAILF